MTAEDTLLRALKMEVLTQSSLDDDDSSDLELTKELWEIPERQWQTSHYARQRGNSSPWKRALLILGLRFMVIAMVGLSFMSVNTYTSLRNNSHASPTGREFGDCGSNIAEARTKGCIFDNMSFHWVRPACYYEDLLVDFRKRIDMPYYNNVSLKEEYRIPTKEIFNGDHMSAWAPASHHPIHCVYLAQMVHLALVNHLPIDSKASDYAHGKHCGMILLDGWLHEMSDCKGGCISGVNAQFTTCGYI